MKAAKFDGLATQGGVLVGIWQSEDAHPVVFLSRFMF